MQPRARPAPRPVRRPAHLHVHEDIEHLAARACIAAASSRMFSALSTTASVAGVHVERRGRPPIFFPPHDFGGDEEVPDARGSAVTSASPTYGDADPHRTRGDLAARDLPRALDEVLGVGADLQRHRRPEMARPSAGDCARTGREIRGCFMQRGGNSALGHGGEDSARSPAPPDPGVMMSGNLCVARTAVFSRSPAPRWFRSRMSVRSHVPVHHRPSGARSSPPPWCAGALDGLKSVFQNRARPHPALPGLRHRRVGGGPPITIRHVTGRPRCSPCVRWSHFSTEAALKCARPQHGIECDRLEGSLSGTASAAAAVEARLRADAAPARITRTCWSMPQRGPLTWRTPAASRACPAARSPPPDIQLYCWWIPPSPALASIDFRMDEWGVGR